MKKAFLFACILFICAGGMWWFWSLSRLPKPTRPQILLRVERGVVELKREKSAAWTPVAGTQELTAGDAVRTSAESEATISTFDVGESRLAANTEVAIQEARNNEGEGTFFVVRLRLSSGRVWSRLLRLFDLKSSFSVGTQTVVATVRGTAFDLHAEATSTFLSVTDAAVDVSAGNGAIPMQKIQPLIVSRGSLARFDSKGKLLASEPVSDAMQRSEWFVQNSTRDAVFERRAHEQVVARLAALHPVSPESAFYSLTRWSEQLRLTTDSEQAARVFARYAARRLFAISQLIDSGKSGLGFQALSALEEDVNTRFKGPDGARYRRAVADSLKDLLLLLESVDPTSPAYRLKQRIEDLYVKTQSAEVVDATGAAALMYARLLTLETQLIVAERLLSRVDAEQMKETLDAARQGLANVERDIDRLPPKTATDDVASLRIKLFVLKARETDIRSRLSLLIQASQATSTPPVSIGSVVTSTAPLVSPVTSTIPAPSLQRTPTSTQIAPTPPELPPRPTTASLQSITFIAQPNPAQVGDKVRLVVTGRRTDGSESDVTALARFELFGALGSLNGPTYNASQSGSITIQATVIERGTPLSARATIQIQSKPIILTAIEVLPIGSNAVGLGGRALLRARAIYSDGSTKDVTQSTTFTVADQRAGSLIGNIFQAGQELTTTRITGTYTEAGVNVIGSTELSVGLEVR